MNDDLGLDVITAAGRFTRQLGRTTQGSDGPSVWRSLAVVEELAPVSVGDFASHYRCSQPAATTLLGRLEKEGALEKHEDPRDRRVRAFSLTDAGKARLEKNRTFAAGLLRAELEALSQEEVAALRTATALLGRFADALESPQEGQK